MSPYKFPLVQLPLAKHQYKDEITPKSQIFLHHTAGNGNPYAVVDYWASSPEAISTAFIIARGNGKHNSKQSWKDGEVYQCFPSNRWGWHLGITLKELPNGKLPSGSKSSRALNAEAVGIELCNWGQLSFRNGKYYTWANSIIPKADVITLDPPFRGLSHWQRYTDAQIESTYHLLQYLGTQYNIDLKYKGNEIFAMNDRCFRGESGVWTHNAVRTSKWDCFPQPELISMLQSL